jgi:hypothetical protein
VPALKTPLRTSGAIAGKQAGTSHGVSPGIAGSYGQTRTSFEVNEGQTDSQVQFLSRGSGYTLFLTKTEAVWQLPIGDFRLQIGSGEQSRRPAFSIRNPQSEIHHSHCRLTIFDCQFWIGGLEQSGHTVFPIRNPKPAIRNFAPYA